MNADLFSGYVKHDSVIAHTGSNQNIAVLSHIYFCFLVLLSFSSRSFHKIVVNLAA